MISLRSLALCLGLAASLSGCFRQTQAPVCVAGGIVMACSRTESFWQRHESSPDYSAYWSPDQPVAPQVKPCPQVGATATFDGAPVLSGCGDSVSLDCHREADGSKVCVARVAVGGKPEHTLDRSTAIYVLAAVDYRACGTGGEGRVEIVFDPAGVATSASVVDGTYDATARACIASHFIGVRIPPFDGEPRTVAWHVRLPNGSV